MAIRSSSSFSHLQPGVFHISLRTHKTQHTQPRGWKNREQTRTWVSSKRRKGAVCYTFPAFCASVSYRERVFERNSHKAHRNADSSPHVGQPGLWVHRPSSSSLLLSSVVCFLLFCSGSFLHSSSPGLIGNLARMPFVWVSRQNRQRDPRTGIHTHRNKYHPSCHSINTCEFLFRYFFVGGGGFP